MLVTGLTTERSCSVPPQISTSLWVLNSFSIIGASGARNTLTASVSPVLQVEEKTLVTSMM